MTSFHTPDVGAGSHGCLSHSEVSRFLGSKKRGEQPVGSDTLVHHFVDGPAPPL